MASFLKVKTVSFRFTIITHFVVLNQDPKFETIKLSPQSKRVGLSFHCGQHTDTS